MKKRAFMITACVLIVFAMGAILLKGGDGGLQQGGDWNMQSFFTAKVMEHVPFTRRTRQAKLLRTEITNSSLSGKAKTEK